MKRVFWAKGLGSQILAMTVGVAAGLIGWVHLNAQQPGAQLREPVFRVSKANNVDNNPQAPAHPLDPALDIARNSLNKVRGDIRDYRCILVKRERINGELNDHQYMFTKVRNRQYDQAGRPVVPFSVYMYFLKPTDIKGREVIYVEGQNNDKLCAHEGGGSILPTVWLHPQSALAMRGQLYPITDVGIENLVLKLIERGQIERRFPDVEVSFKKDARVNDRTCTILELRHPNRRPEFEFYHAQIFIDDELGVPIRYAAFGWPEKGQEPPVLEEYTYLKLEVNVGLQDADFDHKNPKYNF
jgi:hypothetical protein